MTSDQSAQLSELFRVLGNDTRLRLLHALARAGQLCVTELGETVGMRAQAVSNQLQRLADRGIVAATRHGNHIHYRIVDPCVTGLLEQGWCLAEDAWARRA
jgi:DNA-binding transcriptional ArsR family regulator